MIVDTSALMAILLDEGDAQQYAAALAKAGPCRLSAATFVEAAVVIEVLRKGVAAVANSMRYCDEPASRSNRLRRNRRRLRGRRIWISAKAGIRPG